MRRERPLGVSLTAGSCDSAAEAERFLAAAAVALGARRVPRWSAEEEQLARRPAPLPPQLATRLRERIRGGEDPLGEEFCRVRSPKCRRARGATYTPPGIVEAMVERAARDACPQRIVDPGLGSGRFLVAAGRRFPNARLLGVELDPLPALIARGNLAASGMAGRAEVVRDDYRAAALEPLRGRTLFVGNPPYVRHHLISPGWKRWFVDEAGRRGLVASRLAGMHAHFYLATALKAAAGDCGSFITAAEWLDVNYGGLVRELLLQQLGLREIILLEPTTMPFPDAAVTAAITRFQVGSRPHSIRLGRVRDLDELRQGGRGRAVRRGQFRARQRWSRLTQPGRRPPAGYVELGELCRVHRGQATGANRFWIHGPHSEGLPGRVLVPTVTGARELFRAGGVLSDVSRLRRVIDLPADLGVFEGEERRAIERFLRLGRRQGVPLGYLASHRKAWWSVGLPPPAPILASYMARRRPAFVRNPVAARHLNVAHGIYPRQRLRQHLLMALVDALSEAAHLRDGRTYAGGLTKFEPREMERLLVPGLELLERSCARDAGPGGRAILGGTVTAQRPAERLPESPADRGACSRDR